jgi:cytochrome b561
MQHPLAPRDDDARFGRVARALHWLTFLMLVGSFALVWSVGWLTAGPTRAQAIDIHRTIGLFVLTVTALRLIWRMVSQRAPNISKPKLRWVADIVHAILLVCLLTVPLLGWAYTNARGHTVILLGLRLPSLIFKDQYFSRVAIGSHEFLAYTLLTLIGVHVAASLWHHLVLRDATLKRMWLG